MKHPPSVDISSREADIEQQAHMTAYLLGELSQEQQIALERDYFAGNDVYDQLLAVEDELAYDYLQGRLSPERRARFENTIGRTERGRKNLEFARALLDTLKATQPQRHYARYWAMGIAAAFALAVVPAWLALRLGHLTAEVERLRSEQVVRTAPAPRPAPVEVAFLLIPGRARSAGDAQRLDIAADTDNVRFELLLPPGAPPADYAVVLSAPNGDQVWSQSAKVTGRAAIAVISGRLLPAGVYEIAIRRLTAGEQLPDLATYSFRVSRR